MVDAPLSRISVLVMCVSVCVSERRERERKEGDSDWRVWERPKARQAIPAFEIPRSLNYFLFSAL
jgi:hypothetical protein